MKSRKLSAGLALVVLSFAASVASAQHGRSRELASDNGWVFDYRQAQQLAAEANKPLLVVFRCVP